MASTNVGSIEYDARINTSKMKGDAAQVEGIARQAGQSLTSKLGDAAQRVGQSATYLTTRLGIVGAALGILGRKALNMTSDFQQNRIAFDTMLGSASKGQKMMKELSEFAKKTPFNLPEVAQGAKSLLAYGISAEKIVPTFNALGNIAAGVGRDKLPQLTLAYGQVRTATKLTGMELRQFTEAGVPLLAALAKQSGKSAAQIKDDMENGAAPSFAEVQKAIFAMSEKGGKFYNLMEKQSQTFAGRMSNIGDSVQQIIRGMLGVDVEGNVKPGGIFDLVTQAAKTFMDFLANNQDRIIGVLTNVFGFILEHGKEIAIFFGTILTAAFITWGAAVIAASWPILLVAGLLVGLYKAVEALNERFHFMGPILEWVKRTFEAMKPTLQAIWTVITTQLIPAFGQFILGVIQWLIDHKDIFISIWNGFVSTLKTLWTIAKAVADIFMTWFWPSIKALATTIWTQLLPALKTMWDSIVRLWHSLNPALMQALKVVGAIIGGLLIGAIWLIINVFNIAIKIIALVVKIIATLIGWISNLIKWFGNAVVAVWRFLTAGQKAFNGFLIAVLNAVERARAAIANFAVKVVNAIIGVRDKIVSVFSGAGKWLFDAGKNVILGLVNGIKSAIGGAVDAVKGGVSSIVGAAKNALGIHSPSTVFEGIGKNIGLGLARGISNSQAIVNGSMGKILPVGDASVGVNNLGDAGMVTGTGGGVTVQLNMKGIMARSRSDLREISKDMIRSVNEELTAKQIAPIGGGAL